MDRKDFRPNSESSTMSDKDRQTIRENNVNQDHMNSEYHYSRATISEEKADKHLRIKYNATAYDIAQAHKYHDEQLRKEQDRKDNDRNVEIEKSRKKLNM